MHMKTKKKTLLLPLTRQFAIVLILFTLCMVGITAFTTYAYAGLQTSFFHNSLESYSTQMAKNTSQAYESYENICYNTAYSRPVQNYLTDAASSENYENYKQLESQLSNAALLNSFIIDIAVFGANGNFASLRSPSENYAVFVSMLSDCRFSYRSAGTAVIDSTLCHILAMPVYSLGSWENKYLGLLFLAVDTGSLLSNTLSDDSSRYHPEILLTDSDGQLIYGNTRLYDFVSGAGQNAARDQIFTVKDGASPTTYAVRSYSIPCIDHTLYVLIDKSNITGPVVHISLRLLLSISGLLLLMLFLLFALYRPLIRSLKQLTDYMKTISAGDRRFFKEGIPFSQGLLGSSEINDISNAFNEMLLRTNQLNHTIFDTYTRMYELEVINRKTEIAFLRSQINPHFLYNTLTMICGMAAEGMNDKVISVTGALSQIFRYSIKGSEMVTLAEEMEIVRSYLMIQKERFDNRFAVEYEFSEDSHVCLIPKMVIQPLVENAIVHGLEKSLRPGKLLIGAGRNPEHGYLAIWIFDTGVGMPAEKLEELRRAVSLPLKRGSMDAAGSLTGTEDTESHDSVGILNVNSRMVLYYGENYTLIIDSEEGVGTNIQLRVPYRTHNQETSVPKPSDTSGNEASKKGNYVPGNCN